MEASISMPAMIFTTAQPWVVFLRALKGQVSVFQLTADFMAAYPGDIGTRYWRLKSNTAKWSISKDRVYGLAFDVREVL